MRCRRLEAQYLLIVARQNIIITSARHRRRLGLRLLGILPTPIAEAAATMTIEEMALGCAYVNIGGGYDLHRDSIRSASPSHSTSCLWVGTM